MTLKYVEREVFAGVVRALSYKLWKLFFVVPKSLIWLMLDRIYSIRCYKFYFQIFNLTQAKTETVLKRRNQHHTFPLHRINFHISMQRSDFAVCVSLESVWLSLESFNCFSQERGHRFSFPLQSVFGSIEICSTSIHYYIDA